VKRTALTSLLLAAGLVPGMPDVQAAGLPAAGFAAGGTGLTPFYVMGFELGPWQDYLARELTPEFMDEASLPELHVSWLNPELVSILPAFAEGLVRKPDTWLRYELEWHQLETVSGGNSASLQAPGLGFERQLLAPGIFHELDSGSILGVEAIMAYQSFGTSDLGFRSFGSAYQPGQALYQPVQESSYGTGVRLNVSQPMAERFTLGVGFQSRIDMEEFANYRGVYANPADFDIPARASLGVAYHASEQSSLNLSVERILYSEVNAFQSRNLPDRFLSMLGDSTSPDFTLDDLTVFTLGYTWSNGKDTQWRAEVSSRSTPSPSSAVLERALSQELADHAMLVGYSRRTGEFSRFNLNAAYAPSDYLFGGNVLGVASEDLGQDLELEAVWTLDF
jgi:hypothetical protein